MVGWKDPQVIVPIIAAVITSIAAPILSYHLLQPHPITNNTRDTSNIIPKEDPDKLTRKGDDIIRTFSDSAHINEALAYYDKALSIDPNYENALFGEGSALRKLHRENEALTYYDKALVLDPNNKNILTERGGVAFDLTRYNEAINYFSKALDVDPKNTLDPNNYVVFNAIGSSYFYSGNYNEALAYYDKALAINPNNKVISDNKQKALYFINIITGRSSRITFKEKWGANLNGPQGIGLDPNTGTIYIADTHNEQIQKFTSKGNFITKWGSSGSNDGEFHNPTGISIDSSGNVYVADWGNGRIQKFNSSGAFITKWGSSGSNDGQFNGPAGVAVDSSGNVYVTDSNNNRIQVFATTTL